MQIWHVCTTLITRHVSTTLITRVRHHIHLIGWDSETVSLFICVWYSLIMSIIYKNIGQHHSLGFFLKRIPPLLLIRWLCWLWCMMTGECASLIELFCWNSVICQHISLLSGSVFVLCLPAVNTPETCRRRRKTLSFHVGGVPTRSSRPHNDSWVFSGSLITDPGWNRGMCRWRSRQGT